MSEQHHEIHGEDQANPSPAAEAHEVNDDGEPLVGNRLTRAAGLLGAKALYYGVLVPALAVGSAIENFRYDRMASRAQHGNPEKKFS